MATQTIEIYFSGLICLESLVEDESTQFVHRRNKSHAKLIEDSDHEPFITITGTTEPLTTGVRFDNLGAGPTTTTPLFNATVPHLDDLTKSGIKLKKANRGLIVNLPSGEKLTVAKFYEKKARFQRPNQITPDDPVCLPKLTLITVDFDDEDEDKPAIEYNNKSVELKGGDWVLIENAALALPSPIGSHWKKHSKATTGGGSDLADYLPDTTDCKTPAEPGTHTAAAEAALRAVHLPADAANDDEHGGHGPDDRGKVHAHGDPADTHSECTNSQWP